MTSRNGTGHRSRDAHGRRISFALESRRERRLRQCDLVPVAPLRQRFEELHRRGEMTVGDLCIYMGWVFPVTEERARAERRRPGTVTPNRSYARRVLGQAPTRGVYRTEVSYDTALRLASCLGMDPWEAGV